MAWPVSLVALDLGWIAMTNSASHRNGPTAFRGSLSSKPLHSLVNAAPVPAVSAAISVSRADRAARIAAQFNRLIGHWHIVK
jgi:hypothetical protein